MKTLAAIAIGFIFASNVALAKESGITKHQILSTDKTVTGQQVEVPANPQVVATIVEIAPGASLPVHEHPYARYAYVLDGVLDVTIVDEKKTFTSKPGDFIVEMRGQKHFGTNHGKVPVKLLVIDQMPQGVVSNVVIQDKPQ